MKKLRAVKILLLASGILCLFTVFILRRGGAGREPGEPLAMGNIPVPGNRSVEYNATSPLREQIIDHWTHVELEDWVYGEKVDLKEPRTVLACLTAGRRVEEVNKYLLRQKATGTAGSRWLLNPRGGYNFTTMACTPLLYLFGDKPGLLYPETLEHLAKQILTIEGGGFSRKVPRLPIQDSENHILMAGSSRYLKNQWLRDKGEHSPEFDNRENGVEEGLKSYLQEIYDYGLYEFNSDPYMGYTLSALLNLQAFAGGEIQSLAEKILDRLSWQYAVGSYEFKHFPPYRRRFKKAFRTDISADYHTSMMKVWASLFTDTIGIAMGRGQHHALWASIMPYRPPDGVMEWTLRKPHAYYVKIGHGHNSCPEIYSGDREFLISAGGANQGRNSLIMPKPIVLFLDDDAKELEETFHMYGPGEDFMQWNNTGVYIDFACARGQVHVPEGRRPVITREKWQIFHLRDHVWLAVYSENTLGLMAIIRAGTSEAAIDSVIKSNPDEGLLDTQFTHPGGNRIEYDLNTSKDTWVIDKINGKAVDRKFDRWPFFEGFIDGLEVSGKNIDNEH